jgi:DNA-binding LacI/PurR family transcriptional regulator
VGLLAAANEFGVKIPDELSIISLSTTSNQIPSTWPALTIVAVPAATMGYDAMIALVDQLEHRSKTPTQKLYCGDLEISGTTGIARVGEIHPR